LITPASALRVCGSKVLKTWSRSTAVVVASWSRTPPSGIFSPLVGREVDALHGADRRAAGLHEVPLDELGGVLEARLDRVVAAG
jgi:hypothetical protein